MVKEEKETVYKYQEYCLFPLTQKTRIHYIFSFSGFTTLHLRIRGCPLHLRRPRSIFPVYSVQSLCVPCGYFFIPVSRIRAD